MRKDASSPKCAPFPSKVKGKTKGNIFYTCNFFGKGEGVGVMRAVALVMRAGPVLAIALPA